MSDIDGPVAADSGQGEHHASEPSDRRHDASSDDASGAVSDPEFNRVMSDWQDAQQTGNDNLPLWATPFAWWDGML